MISDMPNLAWIFGYIRSSWTLRSDLIGRFVCRLLQHMDEIGMRQVTPRLRAEDEGMAGKAFIDPDDFAPGYIRRGAGRLPQQSGQGPWSNCQDYYQERHDIPAAPLEDGVLQYSNPKSAESGVPTETIVQESAGVGRELGRVRERGPRKRPAANFRFE